MLRFLIFLLLFLGNLFFAWYLWPEPVSAFNIFACGFVIYPLLNGFQRAFH